MDLRGRRCLRGTLQACGPKSCDIGILECQHNQLWIGSVPDKSLASACIYRYYILVYHMWTGWTQIFVFKVSEPFSELLNLSLVLCGIHKCFNHTRHHERLNIDGVLIFKSWWVWEGRKLDKVCYAGVIAWWGLNIMRHVSFISCWMHYQDKTLGTFGLPIFIWVVILLSDLFYIVITYVLLKVIQLSRI